MAGKDFEAFKHTIEEKFMGHPVVTNNAYTRWFSRWRDAGRASAAIRY